MPPVSWLRMCFLMGVVTFAGISAQLLRGAVGREAGIALAVLSSIGVVAGVTLLTVNLAWGTAPFVWRCFEHWMWFAVGMFVLAVTLQPPQPVLVDLLSIVCWYSLCCQTALWVARYFLNTRIALPASDSHERWGLRDIAIGLTFIAVSLAFIRAARDVYFWLMVGALYGAIAMLVAIPPAVIVLRMKWWIVGLLFYLTAVIGSYFGINYFWRLVPKYVATEEAMLFLVAVIGPCFGVLILKLDGYRLLWRRETNGPN